MSEEPPYPFRLHPLWGAVICFVLAVVCWSLVFWGWPELWP